MNEFSRDEKYLLIEAINHSIAYRLKNSVRLREIKPLRQAKKKLEESIKLERQKKRND